MPLHPDILGLEAWIIVDGHPLEEHDMRAPVARKSVERYITAESGSTFEVHFRFSHPFPTRLPVTVLVTVDGRDLDEPLIRTDELYNTDGHRSTGPISNVNKAFYKQKYRFKEVNIKEGEPGPGVEAQKAKLAQSGTISLNFFWIKSICLNESFQAAAKILEDPGTIHEKALKGNALSHTLSLAEPEPTEELDFFDAEYADNGEPFAAFHFHYRSLKALQDLHIIKRTPEPLDLLECNDEIFQTSSSEELRRMFAHWKRQEVIRRRLKRERSESATVIGDDEFLGDSNTAIDINGSNHNDEDLVIIGAVDLRKERRKRRKPTQQDEIIELD
ncbi:hypothetical protein N0V90_008290 [Kalmusia sp. IMI 367209]|nr:hypothetical protein N0V90_008290 [Kalmusia sp. IMI 367209]